ncbi:MAG: SRPBCC domain-containing protein [Flavobacteriaceae bacterium]
MANIKHNFTIHSSLQKVYEVITTEKGLRGWWTIGATAKPEEGFINHFEFGPSHFKKMKITRLEEPSQVHWRCVDGDHEWIGTTVLFVLEDRKGATFLKFSHNDWTEESEYFGVCTYHWGRFLVSLKLLCETGKGEPFMG